MTDATSPSKPLKVLVYSDDANTRQQVMLALGKRPHPDLPELHCTYRIPLARLSHIRHAALF